MSSSEQRVRHFQEELEQLKARLLEMGGLAEDRGPPFVRRDDAG